MVARVLPWMRPLLSLLQAAIGIASVAAAAGAATMAVLAWGVATAAEERAERARLDAEYQECRAVDSRIEAEILLSQATCLKREAAGALCDARNNKANAYGAVAGGILGFFGAGGVGGVGGAAIGGSASEWAFGETCDTTPCQTDPEFWRRKALDKLGLDAAPVCIAPPESR